MAFEHKPVIQSIEVKYIRDIPAMSNRRLRALLHQMWILGNESIWLHNEEEALEERTAAINHLLVREGFAKPKE